MKLKNTIIALLAASVMAGVTSCENILKVDSKTVMYDEENTLNHVTDTVYSVLGILKQIQKIADRTVILGEIRGDLVKVSNHASDDLRELYSYDFANLSSTNKYDKAVDYYSVINNCNFFLTHADTSYVRDRKNVFKGEYITVLAYRAWAYLQLAQVYGKVPYFDKPITGDNASAGTPMDIKQLAQTLLLDFNDEYISYYDKFMPNYGKLGGETTGDGQKSEQHESKDVFIPIRIIMGDLCLWAGEYARAAMYYHDFLTFESNPYTTGINCVSWLTNDFLNMGSDNYTSTIFGKSGHITYIPMEADHYSGEVSDLANIFNSTRDNDYWYQLTRSQAATAISVRQNYCYYAKRSADNSYKWPAYMTDKNAEDELLYRGDLRLQAVLDVSYRSQEDEENNLSSLGTELQTLNKIKAEKVWIYRKDVIYLRLAEALNRCGLPQTAFAILKYGLSTSTVADISQAEKDRAAALGISAVYNFPSRDFIQATPDWYETSVSANGTRVSYYCFRWYNNANTMGIHSRGSGDAADDPNYTIKVDTVGGRIPTLTDSIRAVEEALIDEMALETCFEGYRFGDLMRIAMHRVADAESPAYGGFAENDFLAKRVAIRETATYDETKAIDQTRDETLYTKLKGDGRSFNKAWFLLLPDEKQQKAE